MHLATVLATWFFARRAFGALHGVWIATSLAFSPLLLGIGRQALMDGTVLFASSLSVWLFLEAVERPLDRRPRILFALSFLVAILVKELAAFLCLPFLAYVAWQRWWRRRPLSIPAFVALLALPGLVALPLLVLAAGGVEPLAATFRGILAGPATNPYTVQLGSGPWYRYLVDYLVLSPGPTLCALFFAGALALRERRREAAPAPVFLLVLACLLLFQHAFVTKNVRYLMVLELPLRTFAVLWLAELLASRRPIARAALVGLAVAGLAWLDVRTFEYVFVENRAYDPVTYPLLVLRHMVPWAR